MPSSRRARNAAVFARTVHDAGRGGPGLLQRVRAVPRMVRAVRTGQYTGLTSTRLLMLLAGVGYVISPVDVVPEGLLLAVGLVDDLLVVGWVATTLVRETEDFLAWEQGAPAPEPHQPPRGHTVPSYVVPE